MKSPLASFIGSNVPDSNNYVRWRIKGGMPKTLDSQGREYTRITSITARPALDVIIERIVSSLKEKRSMLTGSTFSLTLNTEWFREGDVLSRGNDQILVTENPKINSDGTGFEYKVRYI